MTSGQKPADLVALILAAGSGSRLGRGPKALLQDSQGRSLVQRAIRATLDGGCQGAVVVIGSEAERVSEHLRRVFPDADGALKIVANEDWRSGMAGSLAAGTAALEQSTATAVITLVDQPDVSARMIRRLISAHQPGRITAAAFSEDQQLRRGHPLLLDCEQLVQAAAQAEGDAGAREFLRHHSELIDLVDCSDLGTGRDVDVEADLGLIG